MQKELQNYLVYHYKDKSNTFNNSTPALSTLRRPANPSSDKNKGHELTMCSIGVTQQLYLHIVLFNNMSIGPLFDSSKKVALKLCVPKVSQSQHSNCTSVGWTSRSQPIQLGLSRGTLPRGILPERPIQLYQEEFRLRTVKNTHSRYTIQLSYPFSYKSKCATYL